MPTFAKEERLCSQKLIDQLYSVGERLMVFPFSVRWMVIPESNRTGVAPCKVMMVVPKRRHKLAVDRNRGRRLMRECYRLQKSSLTDYLDTRGLQVAVAIVYVHNEIMPYEAMACKMHQLLLRLKSTLEQNEIGA